MLPMFEILVTEPDYFSEVESRLNKTDWLVHNFQLDDEEGAFSPAAYLYNIYFNGVEYRASVDLNIFQYVVNCVKKSNPHEFHRDACAMLLFCRMSEISIEPSLAVNERIDYGNGNLDEALHELGLFYALDNADPILLADYMLGNSSNLDVNPFKIDKEGLAKRLTQHQRLEEWDSIYVCVLALVQIYYDPGIEPTHRMTHYVDWMIRDFRLSQPCLVFAARFFGHTPRGGMMKFKPRSSPRKKLAQLRNMTWDLFQINHYFRNWTAPEKQWEELLFTQDRALRESLRLAIRLQYLDDLDPLLNLLRPREIPECKELLQTYHSRSDRTYGSEDWSPDHRASLIEKLEIELGLR